MIVEDNKSRYGYKGFIKLHRSLLDWEWYDDKNCVLLLVHLLCSVNYEDKKWRGIVVTAGSMVTSWESLSNKSGISVQSIRTAIKKLENSGELTREVTNKYQLITLTKWSKLQIKDSELTSKLTNKQQTTNKQLTTTKESKEIKEVFIKGVCLFKNAYSDFSSFELDFNKSDKSTEFKNIDLNHYFLVVMDWSTGNNKKRKDWKAVVRNWIRREIKEGKVKEKVSKRDYL